MMKKAFLGIAAILVIALWPQADLFAQCSMCTINAEQGTQNGNTQAMGINDGVIYLLAIPYVLIAVVGFIWYKNYRKKLDKSSVS